MYLYKVRHNEKSAKTTEIVTKDEIKESDKKGERYQVKDVHGDVVSFVSYELVRKFEGDVNPTDISSNLGFIFDHQDDFDVDYDIEVSQESDDHPYMSRRYNVADITIKGVKLVGEDDPEAFDLAPDEIEYMKTHPIKVEVKHNFTAEGKDERELSFDSKFAVYLKVVDGKLKVVDHDIQAD